MAIAVSAIAEVPIAGTVDAAGASDGAATMVAAVSGVGFSTGSSVGTLTSVASVAGTGYSIAYATGTVTCSAAVSGAARVTATVTGTSTSTSTVSGRSRSLIQGAWYLSFEDVSPGPPHQPGAPGILKGAFRVVIAE